MLQILGLGPIIGQARNVGGFLGVLKRDLRLSLAGGGEFMDGRGSAVFSVDYSRQKSIKASDRSFAGTGLFGLGFANQAIFDQLGLTDGDFGLPAGQRPSQAFYPNVTLPVSSRSAPVTPA